MYIQSIIRHYPDEIPKRGKRIIVVSESYPKNHEMRVRIIDSQFLSICKEVDYWYYAGEL